MTAAPYLADGQEATGGARVPPFTSATWAFPVWWAGAWWARSAAGWTEAPAATSPVTWSDMTAADQTAALKNGARLLDMTSGRTLAVLSPNAPPVLLSREGSLDRARTGSRPTSSAAELAPPPSPYVHRRQRRGRQGVIDSSNEVRDRILRDRLHRAVIADTRQVLARTNLAHDRGYPDPSLIVRALFEDQKKRVAFVQDPTDSELMGTTTEIMCLDPTHCDCWRAGDCDDQLVALGARCASAGVHVALRIRRYAGADEAHVTMLYQQRPGAWGCIDPSTDSGECSTLPFVEEIIVDVTKLRGADGGDFIGLGAPAIDAPATLGAQGPGATALSANDSAAVMQWIGELRGELSAKAVRLKNAHDALVTVRASLGMPQYDPPTGGMSLEAPLAQYALDRAFTQDVDTVEGKLQAVSSFMLSVLDDAASGKRAVTWDASAADNDYVWVAGKPGDLARVAIQKNPTTGAPVLTLFDATTGIESGTLGIGPVLIGIGIIAAAAVTIGAVVLAVKAIDELTQAHTEDAAGKVLDEQNKLVQSGQETPEQSAAWLKAAGGLRGAYQPPESSSSSSVVPAWLWTVGGALLLLGGGIFAVKTAVAMKS